MKEIEVVYWYSNGYYCFTCTCGKGFQFSNEKYNYCPRCGKKLIWPPDNMLRHTEGEC